jgi:hypothetical protein
MAFPLSVAIMLAGAPLTTRNCSDSGEGGRGATPGAPPDGGPLGGGNHPKGKPFRPYTPPDLVERDPRKARSADDIAHSAEAWFAVSLASILCCCLFGILGSVLAHQAKTLAAEHRYEEAESKLRAAKIVTVAAFALALLGFVLQFAGALLHLVF